ncbi:acetate--CoA ligase [Sphingopyxis sp. OPL5]|uniref:acetate--CoA ligase n=1 Tax=Sphingopyxis sp. OPL5 TaxID=2486273 RepID=UPI00164D5FE8|nr:acetate--CoA ligase [Sphingopyxis sp. OPL5]QNO27225.1 acetate--CoA ligase [Sphingopyxis sp. OPL5]
MNDSLALSPREARWRRSLDEPDDYWLAEADRLDWIRKPTRAGDWSFDEADFHVRWFEDGMLNASANCLDRHCAVHPDKTAIIWEPDDPDAPACILTYGELREQVCRFANVLRNSGVGKGDRVTIYLPMIPEAAIALLACARIGAIHSVVFGGFSPEALAARISDCGSRVVVTADEGRRGGKRVPLKANVDAALALAPIVETVIVVRATEARIFMEDQRDVYLDDALGSVAAQCVPEPMAAEDPLFILYTSGSTGKPKGVVHSTAGYLLWVTATFAETFRPEPDEVFFCSADIGWITGHSYIVYGALANGATTVMFEGIPNWPTPARLWDIVARHKVGMLYTAPTALRSLMREGDHWVTRTDRSSLRLLGSVGEPINPEAWRWYHDVVGEGRCPIVDTWWQTETGGQMITAFADTRPLKPGAAQLPFYGVEPCLLDGEGKPIKGPGSGNLAIARSWPGQMRGVWGEPERFFETYFRTFPGYYFTGDGARRDEDGEWWLTGRVDDVINVSGHRLGTAEIESALVLHPRVAEAAVVGVPHDLKGQGIYVFATLNEGEHPDDGLRGDLIKWVRGEIGPIAAPDTIQFAPALPKTRSGKIMRRILRKIAEGQFGELGDVSTLADPAVVSALIHGRG